MEGAMRARRGRTGRRGAEPRLFRELLIRYICARGCSEADMKDYFQLIKPRITLLILIVAMGSFYLADRGGSPDWKRFAIMSIATGLLASGIFALNAYLERETDLLMRRTASRPLPGKRLLPRQALAFGVIVTACGLFLLSARLGWIAGVVGLFTFVSYVLVYTPLKRRTALHTAVGALSGATPPLIGWAAARGSLEPGAWILSGILFLWQFPHFLAIESMYRDDYERAGIRVLPVS
ncbi:MAG: heme o synthase, partial [Spirochaetia bacterium]